MAYIIDLTGQVSLVTGGATGIGAETCRTYAEAGSDVVINYYPCERDRAEAAKLKEEIADMGVRVMLAECDITDEKAVNEMVKNIIEEFGRIDNLFNNAGILISASTTELSYEDFTRLTKVSIDGTFLVTKAVLPYMLKQGAGDIIMMGSGNTINGGGGSIAYPAAKGAVEGMMARLVEEYGAKGIRVNTIRPMVIMTPLMDGRYTPEGWQNYLNHMPTRKAGTTKDVANVVVYLSDRKRSGYILGAKINVDGGRIDHVIFK